MAEKDLVQNVNYTDIIKLKSLFKTMFGPIWKIITELDNPVIEKAIGNVSSSNSGVPIKQNNCKDGGNLQQIKNLWEN